MADVADVRKTWTITEAWAHPGLFGPHFRGNSWINWLIWCKTLMAEPLSDAEAEVFRECTGRTTVPKSPFTEAALIVGRRGGKSRILALIAVFLACLRSYTKYLAPGEVATIAIIAADRKQARAIFRYTLGLLQNIKALQQFIDPKGLTAETITLKNRVVIEIQTASFRVTRGYTFAAVLADETAFWKSDVSVSPDTEIFRALRPGLSTIPGALMLNASSPYRKSGELFNTFRRHFGKDDARVLVWQASTSTMNPSMDPEVVAEAYRDDPESASAEYGAQFRSDIADFVSRDAVEACTVSERLELLPIAELTYSAGIDPSGGSADSMTLGIAHDRDGVAVLDCIREIKPPFSPSQVVEEFSAVLTRYGVKSVIGDRWGGDFVREPFRANGIDYKLSPSAKSELYQNLLPLLNGNRLELLDHPRLAAQLVGLERRTARSGRDSIDHGPGGHDDVINAAALALLAASGASSRYDATMNWVDGYSELAGF